jgi:hypothetical protein
MKKEANGLYSFHSAANYFGYNYVLMDGWCTLVDSLGNEHEVKVHVQHGHGSVPTVAVELTSTDSSAYPKIQMQFMRRDGKFLMNKNTSTGLSAALNQEAEQLTITFTDTGAQLMFDISDAKLTSSGDTPVITTGGTRLWDFPPMVFKEEWVYELTQSVYTISPEKNNLLWFIGVIVERNGDGSFTGRLSASGFEADLYFDEEGRVSGYKVTKNSPSGSSVGIEQTGSLVEGVCCWGCGPYNFDLSPVQIIVAIEPPELEAMPEEEIPAEPLEEASPEEVVAAEPLEREIPEEVEVGFAPLSPSSLSIDENGVLKRLKDDGDWEPIYLLACAQFAAMDSAEERNGVYYATSASGVLRTGVSGKDGMGAITSGALERSTTDLAHELSEMIRAQHAYAANTKVLSTIEDMLTELERL